MPTVSPCTTMVSPAKPIPLVVTATYTSPFTALIVSHFHKSKYENSTCNNSAGGDAMSVARGCLANVTYSSAIGIVFTKMTINGGLASASC